MANPSCIYTGKLQKMNPSSGRLGRPTPFPQYAWEGLFLCKSPFAKGWRPAFCNFPPYTWVHPLYKLTKHNFLHTCMMTYHTNPPHLVQRVKPWEHGIHALDLGLHVINVLPSSLRHKCPTLGALPHCFIPNLPTFMSPTFPCLVCEKLKGTKGNLRKISSIPLVPFHLLSLSQESRQFLFLGVYCIIMTKKVKWNMFVKYFPSLKGKLVKFFVWGQIFLNFLLFI